MIKNVLNDLSEETIDLFGKFMEEVNIMKTVKFLVPKGISSLETRSIAVPICKKAYYFCLLAGQKELSLKQLYIIEKMGFHLKIKYED